MGAGRCIKLGKYAIRKMAPGGGHLIHLYNINIIYLSYYHSIDINRN
jgi:hypothetical protein